MQCGQKQDSLQINCIDLGLELLFTFHEKKVTLAQQKAITSISIMYKWLHGRMVCPLSEKSTWWKTPANLTMNTPSRRSSTQFLIAICYCYLKASQCHNISDLCSMHSPSKLMPGLLTWHNAIHLLSKIVKAIASVISLPPTSLR